MTLKKQFLEAIEKNDIEKVTYLINNSSIDPSYDMNFPIRKASAFGSYDIVKLLLEDSRVDSSDQNCEAFFDSLKNQHFNIAKLLLRKNKNINPFLKGGMAIPFVLLFDSELFFLISERDDFNPAMSENILIRTAIGNGDLKAIKFLWNFKIVKNTLFEQDKELFNDLNNAFFQEKLQNF